MAAAPQPHTHQSRGALLHGATNRSLLLTGADLRRSSNVPLLWMPFSLVQKAPSRHKILWNHAVLHALDMAASLCFQTFTSMSLCLVQDRHTAAYALLISTPTLLPDYDGQQNLAMQPSCFVLFSL